MTPKSNHPVKANAKWTLSKALAWFCVSLCFPNYG